MDFTDVVIVFVKRNSYRFYFGYMNKEEAVNLLRNANLTEKSRKFYSTYFFNNIYFHNIYSLYKRWIKKL